MLDQWRSRRVQQDGRLAWLQGGHPALMPPHCQRPQLALRRTEAGRARSQASFPTVAQVRGPLVLVVCNRGDDLKLSTPGCMPIQQLN